MMIFHYQHLKLHFCFISQIEKKHLPQNIQLNRKNLKFDHTYAIIKTFLFQCRKISNSKKLFLFYYLLYTRYFHLLLKFIILANAMSSKSTVSKYCFLSKTQFHFSILNSCLEINWIFLEFQPFHYYWFNLLLYYRSFSIFEKQVLNPYYICIGVDHDWRNKDMLRL